LAAFALAGPVLTAAAAPATAADVVNFATTKNAGDVGAFLAADRGLFAAEGIDARLTDFDTGAKMVAPLATGELDGGTLPGSAGLYNAVSSRIGIRVVADRSRSAPGHMYQTLMIRKDLIESGRFKDYRDLKGMKIAVAAPGINILSIVNDAATRGGIAYDDVEKVFIPLPQQVAAMRNKAIDASIMIEPFGSILAASGDGVRFASTEDFNPGGEFTYMVFSERFARDRADVARRFMRAYVKALRMFNDAIDAGRWRATPLADDVVSVLAARLEITPAQTRAAFPHAVDPDGRVNLDAMRKELAFFKSQGLVENKAVAVEDIADMGFVDAAARDLGPYKHAP
jgi:NitT/TauT family transport system substrate-binding protein